MDQLPAIQNATLQLQPYRACNFGRIKRRVEISALCSSRETPAHTTSSKLIGSHDLTTRLPARATTSLPHSLIFFASPGFRIGKCSIQEQARRTSPYARPMLPMPGTPGATLSRYKARLAAVFQGADPRVCLAFWLFGMIFRLVHRPPECCMPS